MLCGIALLFAVFTGISVAVGAGTEWVETSVRTDAYDQVNASVSGSVVVWQDYRNKQQVPPNTGTGCSGAQNCTAADIYALDLNGGPERRLTTTYNGLDPDISGSLVAWRNWDTGRIVVYNLSDDSRVDASTAATQMVTPSISGNRVVWGDYRNSIEYGDIYMRDLTQPTDPTASPEPYVTAVSKGSDLPAGKVTAHKDKRNPDIDGDIVVWEDMRNAFQDAQGWWHNPDIYMKNLATGVESAVCANISDQYNPVVSGNRVYWMDYRNGNWDVYMKDISTSVETRLTVNNSHQSWPSASGDFVAWKDTREGDEDIYIKNMVNGVEQRVNTDPATLPTAGQKMPAISGFRVAWMDKRSGNWDIYAARDEVAPQVGPVTPAGLIAGSTAPISALYSDGGTGIDASTVTSLVPVASAVVNNPTTPVSAAWSDVHEGVDEASVHVYLDGVSMESPGITLAAGSFGYQPSWGTRLADGSHTARVVVADLKGAVTDHVWSFTVTSPALANAVVGIYWKSYESYLRRELSVDYRMTDTGTGLCRDATVAAGIASGGVLPAGFPVALGYIASGAAADYSLRYSVPAGVGRFMALNYASCTDDGGNTSWSPGPPPTKYLPG